MKKCFKQIFLILQLFVIIPFMHAETSSSSSPNSPSAGLSRANSAPPLANRTAELKSLLRTFTLTDAPLQSHFIKRLLERITEILPGCRYPKIRSTKNKVTGAHLLHAAAIHNNTSLIISLLILKTDGNIILNDWEPGHKEWRISKVTPLHIAAFFAYTECVAALLAYPKINPNPQDSNGNSPLHIVARSRAKHSGPSGALATAETALLLMENGSCLHKENNDGRTPQTVAQVWSPAISTMITFQKENGCQCTEHKSASDSPSGERSATE